MASVSALGARCMYLSVIVSVLCFRLKLKRATRHRPTEGESRDSRLAP